MLVNNAGVLGLPLTRTADGFETHMGTNYLGHFALTCLLGDRIRDRVVSVTSMNHMFSRMHLDDLNWHTRPYSKWAAYGQSKLAVMLFTDELARRGVRAIVVDPGGADTNIARYSTGFLGWSSRAELAAQLPAEREDRRPVEHHRRDKRPAAGTYLAPVFKQFGKPRVTKRLKKARRRADRGPAMEAVGRADRMRLAALRHPVVS